jgi:integrase
MDEMAKVLTSIAIDKLKPAASRYEVPDGGQRGLLVVVFPSGKKSFIVRYRFGGVKRKLTLGGISLAAARKAAAAALYEVHEGRDPAGEKKAARAKATIATMTEAETVQWCCQQYLKREGDKLRTAHERVRAFERLVYPAIGAVPLLELRRSHIVKLIDTIQDECGDRMADLVLSYLRRAFGWHASRVDDFSSPIVRGMGRYNASERKRTRVLSDDELRRIWLATEPPNPFHALVRFILLTSARRDEARRLPWSEITGTDWTLPVARNKTKVELVRPLSKAAQAVLAGQPHINNGPLVFSSDGHHPMSLALPKSIFDAACGVSGWTLHDLRRTARTLMSRAGVSADIGERALGHVIGGVRGIYDQHKYYREMQMCFEALAVQIARIVNPPANVVVTMRHHQP